MKIYQRIGKNSAAESSTTEDQISPASKKCEEGKTANNLTAKMDDDVVLRPQSLSKKKKGNGTGMLTSGRLSDY